MFMQLPYNIDFELASLVIFLITIFYTYSGKNLPNMVNRIYKGMLLLAFFTTICNLFTVFSIKNSLSLPLEVNYVLNFAYLFLQNMMAPILFVYVYVLTTENENHKRMFWYVIPELIILLCLLLTPVTGLVFYFDENRQYRHGPGMRALYVCGVFYLLMALFYVIKNHRNLNRNQRFAIAFFVFETLLAFVIQKYFPTLLLGGFASAIAVLILYLSLQNPEEKLDYRTGVFNRTAAITTISDYIKQKEPFSMIVLAIDQFGSINETYGFDIGDNLLRSISKFMIGIAPDCVYRLDGDNIAAVFRTEQIRPETVIEEVLKRFQSEWEVGDNKTKLTTCICCLSYPQDAKTVTEVLDTVTHTIADAKEIGSGTIIYANEHIENRENRITELEEQKRLLENISKEAEAARDEAERADRTKSIFLANMSHEIRTPMNAILGMTELVLRDNLSRQVRENMENIKAAGDSLLAIINDLLDISKIESGRLEIVKERYFLSSVLHDISNMVCSRIGNKAIDFFVIVDPNIPNELIGDELRLRQILLNLLTNAVKFTQEGHVILNISGEMEGESASLRISVEDTGFGIKEEEQIHLFESFVRLNQEKTRQIEGTGLGLTICKQLLDLMKGKIWVESTYQKGSTFFVTLEQKIQDKAPLIEVTGKELIKPLVIVRNRNEMGLIKAFRDLEVNAVFEMDSPTVWTILKDVSFSHVFIPYEVFQENNKRITELSKRTKVVILTKYGQYAESKGYISAIQRPVYCLNLGEALNGRLLTKRKKELYETFIAPKARILVVDDNVINLKVAEGLLKPYQIMVTKALSGEECLEKIKTKQYDLVLLDHMMPNMDGIETLKKIRAMEGSYFKNVKIIALTANAVRGIREMYLSSGFHDYISKPIDIARLDEILNQYLPKELKILDKRIPIMEQPQFPYVIEGVDTQKGIANCSGSLELYFELLRAVMVEGRIKRNMMQEYIRTENRKSYLIEVHSLKSVLASIGAEKLSLLAKRHEEEAKAENITFIKEEGEHLLKAYEMLLASIESILKKQDESKDMEEAKVGDALYFSEDEITGRIDHILSLIEAYEDELAMNELALLKGANIGKSQKKMLEASMEALQRFQYEKARAILMNQ